MTRYMDMYSVAYSLYLEEATTEAATNNPEIKNKFFIVSIRLDLVVCLQRSARGWMDGCEMDGLIGYAWNRQQATTIYS